MIDHNRRAAESSDQRRARKKIQTREDKIGSGVPKSSDFQTREGKITCRDPWKRDTHLRSNVEVESSRRSRLVTGRNLGAVYEACGAYNAGSLYDY